VRKGEKECGRLTLGVVLSSGEDSGIVSRNKWFWVAYAIGILIDEVRTPIIERFSNA
jgi:hypothetical protein